MSAARIVPTTGNLRRVGLAGDLVRVTVVQLGASRACRGNGVLHLAKGVRVADGSPVSWFVTDADAKKWGWVQ